MAIRGERFEIDFSDDEGEFTPNPLQDGGLIGEIKERESVAPPAPPKFKSTSTGFPAPRKRPLSKFKQAQQNTSKVEDPASLAQFSVQRGPSDQAIARHISKKHGISTQNIEKKQIDQENKDRLATMSVEEIEEARNELMSNLNPTLLEKLLRRPNFDDSSNSEAGFDAIPEQAKGVETNAMQDEAPIQPPKKTVTFSMPDGQNEQDEPESEPAKPTVAADDAEPTEVRVQSLHFPLPPRDPSDMPDLDPTSPNFIADLQKHYFPTTPHDPNAMSWLQDPSPAELITSPYNPNPTSSSAGIPASALRFSFTGRLLPPSLSSRIDPREGLHHHGLDPHSAGYTVPELSMLARSTVPGQRCIAYMVLGRILYRLGSGEFGSQHGDLADGLWNVIEWERGIEVMLIEAAQEGKGGHKSVQKYAVEGIWLWRKGMEVGLMENERGLPKRSDPEEEEKKDESQ